MPKKGAKGPQWNPKAKIPIGKIVNRHNFYRHAVKGAIIPNLVWSFTVAANAKKWANYLGSHNLFQHSNSSYGENIAAGNHSWISAIDGWASEKKHFIYAPFGNTASKTKKWEDVGHYTQIIWKTTTCCGCGKAHHPKYGTVYVCQYSPAGNMWGSFPY